MNDHQQEQEPTSAAAARETAPSTPPAPRRKRHHWLLWLVLAFIVAPALLLTIWATVTLTYSYSSGERAGYVQKFSRKGWLCKTWEGELAMVNIPGAMQERWDFTVRSDSLARVIESDMGDQVALTYEQHRGVPLSCFGETEYYVTGVRAVRH